MMKLSEVENSLQLVSKYTNLISENNDLYHLAIEENDSSTITECNHSILKIIEDLENKRFNEKYLYTFKCCMRQLESNLE